MIRILNCGSYEIISAFVRSHPRGKELKIGGHQCDQIWRFIILWATFQSPGQQLFCQNRQHILGNFCKGVKIFHFTREILFGQLLQTFGDFLLVTLVATTTTKVIKIKFEREMITVSILPHTVNHCQCFPITLGRYL